MAEEKKKKCAHPACNCPAEKGRYCSQYCKDAGGRMEKSPATATTPNAKPSPPLRAHRSQRKLLG